MAIVAARRFRCFISSFFLLPFGKPPFGGYDTVVVTVEGFCVRVYSPFCFRKVETGDGYLAAGTLDYSTAWEAGRKYREGVGRFSLAILIHGKVEEI